MADEQPPEFVEESEYEPGAGGTDDVLLTEAYEEGEEEMSEDEFSKIGSSSDDPEQKQRYLEYLQLIKEIEAQNSTIAELKKRIMDMCAKTCKTCAEEKNIRDLRNCMEQENLKLKCLISKAMELQNFGSHRHWRDLPVATTFDEDNLRPYVYCTSPRKYSMQEKSEEESQKVPCICEEFFNKKPKQKKRSGSSGPSGPCRPCRPCSPPPECEEDKHMGMVIKELKKLKITCPQDKKLLKEILKQLCGDKSPCPKPCPPPCPRPCQSSSKSLRRSKSMTCSDDSQNDEVVMHLKGKISCMQSAVDKLKRQISKRERMRQQPVEDSTEDFVCSGNTDAIMDCGGKRSTKAEQIEKLKENYCHLLKEYSKKETQLCQMKKR